MNGESSHIFTGTCYQKLRGDSRQNRKSTGHASEGLRKHYNSGGMTKLRGSMAVRVMSAGRLTPKSGERKKPLQHEMKRYWLQRGTAKFEKQRGKEASE